MDTLSFEQHTCTPRERGGIQAPRSSPIVQSIGFPRAKSDGEGSNNHAMTPLHRPLPAQALPSFHPLLFEGMRTCPRMPAPMPLQPVCRRWGAGHACMDDIVVDR